MSCQLFVCHANQVAVIVKREPAARRRRGAMVQNRMALVADVDEVIHAERNARVADVGWCQFGNVVGDATGLDYAAVHAALA